MKQIALLTSLVVAGTAMAASGTKTVTGLIPSGVNMSALTGATSGGSLITSLPASNTLLSFDAVGMGDVPDDAILTSVSYTLTGKLWVDWTILSGVNPSILGSGSLTADGPGAGSSSGGFFYNPSVSIGSGTVIVSPIPGALVNVAGGDIPLFNFANSASTTVLFSLTGGGSFFVGGDGSVDGQQFPYAGVSVSIDYGWQNQETNVPEASTYAAGLGLAGIVGFSWMRNRRR